MNNDTVSGKFDQATGKIKQKVGEAVGNQHLANEGVAEQVKGAAKETWGNVKDAAHDAGKQHKAEAEAHATETRDNIADSTQHIKHKVNEKIDEHRDKVAS